MNNIGHFAENLIGKKFGHLTVINKDTIRMNKIKNEKNISVSYWICECDCESKTIISVCGNSLKHNKKTHCGCQNINRNYIIGNKYGKLLVESFAYSKNNKLYFNCKCDCGNECIINSSRLKNGYTKSCGCLHIAFISNLNKKYNTYNLTGAYGIGYTTNNKEFYFDLEDYDKIKDYCWTYDKQKGYFVNLNLKNSIQRFILNLNNENYLQVDHINGNKYDNRKNNLRVCTIAENCYNKGLLINNTSGYTGVSWSKKLNKWRARIGYRRKEYSLGCFDNLDDAIKARKQAEEKYFGEYARQEEFKNNVFVVSKGDYR